MMALYDRYVHYLHYSTYLAIMNASKYTVMGNILRKCNSKDNVMAKVISDVIQAP